MPTIQQLQQSGAIYLSSVQQGFSQYSYDIIKRNQQEAYAELKNMWIKNGTEGSYVDFYYFALKEEEQGRVEEYLQPDEKEYLNKLRQQLPAAQESDEIIFHLDETLLKIAVKLNEKEALFSTFYFTKSPCTWWGNYNQEYVVFKE